MIRLIATDLDGSLLSDDKQLPKDFFTYLPELKKRGISFFAASGRTYEALRKNFEPVSEEIGYICENGACVVVDGKPMFASVLFPEELSELIDTVLSLPDVHLVLCGQKAAYMSPFRAEFQPYMDSYHAIYTAIQDYHAVSDAFYKLAICDLRGPANNSFPVLSQKYGERFGMAISGPKWMDVMVRGVNKGQALEKVQNLLGVSREETMAFGDYHNDIELLKQAKYGYVMKNAAEDMLQNAEYITPKSNNENGVMELVKEKVLKIHAK